MTDELYHYGTPRHSGRYPWGSGENPYQRYGNFQTHVKELKSQGMSEVEIAESMGMTTSQLRSKMSTASSEIRQANILEATRLKDKGYSVAAISERMGASESTVRGWLKPAAQERAAINQTTRNILKDAVNEKGYIDVGKGTEVHMGISEQRLKNAITALKDEGYEVYYIRENQVGTGEKTSIKVLCPPGTTYSDVYKNRANIQMVQSYSEDGGRTYLNIVEPVSINSKRIQVCYAEDGGTQKDGVIELRRGVDDISLGKSKYAQVRIAVDGTHYLKGMAMYADDLPEGVDIRFNTNKHKGTPMLGEKDNSVLKPMKNDADNPFGATVRQRYYTDSKGKEHLSALNIVNEEGDWGNWSRTLASQFLSKQNPALAKKQLDISLNSRKAEYEEIMSITNPSVKKILLEKFAENCDSAAVHLKAAALPRQASHVILPIKSMKENEIYAPNYDNGEEVILVRYPHGGIFEIPRLKVNNNQPEAKRVMGQAQDAVGINYKVAEQLSGADFDGDTVLVIPTKGLNLKTSAPLEGLKNFDPKEAYAAYPGMPTTGPENGFHKQTEMGSVSNLITDMTIKGASYDEISRAVKHSMVVIDAEKHNLNWRQSYTDNGIAQLKKKYQGGANKGASTLISRAKGQTYVDKRKVVGLDDNGDWIYQPTNETYINRRTGKEVKAKTKSTQMAEAKDAYSLSSGTEIEDIYASYANSMKDLARSARKEASSVKSIPYNPSARKVYSAEVESLDAKLRIAYSNKPLERKAQLLANQVIYQKKKDNPGMDSDTISKLKGQALAAARNRVGAKKESIVFSDREWEAIQAGAISSHKLDELLANADLDSVKKQALPKATNSISPSTKARVKGMYANGATQAEIASALGISTSTVSKIMNEN